MFMGVLVLEPIKSLVFVLELFEAFFDELVLVLLIRFVQPIPAEVQVLLVALELLYRDNSSPLRDDQLPRVFFDHC